MKFLLPLAFFAATGAVWALPATIVVVDGAGKPLQDAQVQFDSFGTPQGTRLQNTDGAGQTRFEVEPDPFYQRFLGRITVWKDGFAFGGGSLKLAKNDAPDATMRVVLTPATTIRGRVVDGEGKPIEGAQVSYALMGAKKHKDNEAPRQDFPVLYDGPLAEKAKTRSDKNGAWQLENVPPNALAWIRVVARGFAQGEAKNEDDKPLEIRLAPGAIVRGQVVGLEGQPLADIEINAQSTNRGEGAGWATAKTDAQGNYELWGLRSGEVNISFAPPRDAPYVLAAHGETAIQSGKIHELGQTKAQSGLEIGGWVHDAKGKGISSVHIGIYGPLNPASGAAVGSASTDKNGLWSFRTLAGANKIYLMGVPGAFQQGSQEKNLTLEAARADISWTLAPAILLGGTVVDEAGKPVQAGLFASPGANSEGFHIQPDESGNWQAAAPKAGRYTLAGNQPYAPPGEWEIVAPQIVSAPRDEPIAIVVRRKKIEGWTLTTRDSDGAPIEGVKAEFLYRSNDNYLPRTFSSDAKGEIALPKPAPGENLSFTKATKAGFDFQSGGALEDGGPQPLILARRDGILRGRIRSEKGEFVSGARVWSWNVEAKSDAEGAFTLENVARDAKEALALGKDGFGRGAGEIQLAPQTLQDQNQNWAREIAADALGKTPADFYGPRNRFFPSIRSPPGKFWAARKTGGKPTSGSGSAGSKRV